MNKEERNAKVAFQPLQVNKSFYMGLPKDTKIEKLSDLSLEQRFHYDQAEKALKMLSGNLKKGNEAFDNLYAYEDSVNKIFKTK